MPQTCVHVTLLLIDWARKAQSPNRCQFGPCQGSLAADLLARRRHIRAAAMRHFRPGARGLAQVVEVPGCGHAPALNVPEHFALVDGFLAKAG